MNDKELMKAAALGIRLPLHPEWDCAENGIFIGKRCDGDLQRVWNPLENDGDALLLLAALPSLWCLKLKFGAPTVEMNIAWGTGGEKTDKISRQFAGEGADRARAIRRAIVEAAALLQPNVIAQGRAARGASAWSGVLAMGLEMLRICISACLIRTALAARYKNRNAAPPKIVTMSGATILAVLMLSIT